jgi:hypothetical protein
MRINQNNLEIKYALELYKELPGFPTQKDLLYVLVSCLEEKDLIDKEFNADNVWSSLRTCYSNITDIRTYINSIAVGENPVLEKTRDDKRGGHFILRHHPWV